MTALLEFVSNIIPKTKSKIGPKIFRFLASVSFLFSFPFFGLINVVFFYLIVSFLPLLSYKEFYKLSSSKNGIYML